MPLALQNSVDIELLIEGSRNELFKKITSEVSPSGRRLSSDDEALTFCIQHSYLSADRSERIFKVKCDNFEHFYYAFGFKGYVVCPAFLVSMFKLTDYACLDVRNDTHYYYIFLSRKEDDPLPIILGEFNFHEEFKLEIPSDKHKLLPLNSITKELICFISPNLEDKDLWNECGRFKSSDQLMKSEFAPSYWFAPDKLKELFKDKYPFVVLDHGKYYSRPRRQQIFRRISGN